VGDFVASPDHAGDIDAAPRRGEAVRTDRLIVRLGLWEDDRGVVTRARFKASTCASLIAFAELACELLEGGAAPGGIDAAFLLSRLEGVHPIHRDRADLVVEALRAATPGALR
jgi:hypothetical protein